MLLQDVLYRVGIRSVAGSTSVEVNDIQIDSRKIKPGSVFVAVKGAAADGHQFIGAENIFDFVKPCSGGGGFNANPVGFFQRLTLFNLDGNARNFGSGFLFEGGIVHDEIKGSNKQRVFG